MYCEREDTGTGWDRDIRHQTLGKKFAERAERET